MRDVGSNRSIETFSRLHGLATTGLSAVGYEDRVGYGNYSICQLLDNLSQAESQARLRLFCFPYAGGGASMFRTWSDNLPSDEGS